jgi:hypothetical protein
MDRSGASGPLSDAPSTLGEAVDLARHPPEWASNEWASNEHDPLRSLRESMEQFVTADNPNTHATDHLMNEQEVQGGAASDAIDLDASFTSTSPVSSRAAPAKRPQRKQGKTQPAKKAKKDIWTAENVLQNPKSPLVNANLKVCVAFLVHNHIPITF